MGTVVLCFNNACGVIGIYVESIEPGADAAYWVEILVIVSLLSPGARYKNERRNKPTCVALAAASKTD